MAWPKKVPILSTRDIYHGDFNGPSGNHCIGGWLDCTFEDDRSFRSAMRSVRKTARLSPKSDIIEWNDRSAKRRIAAVWNRAMRKLGYTQPCNR